VPNIPRLDRAARRRLIQRSKKAKDPDTALRFRMIAKLGQGLSRQQVARDLACVPSTVVKAAKRYLAGGEEALLDQRVFNGEPKVDVRFKETLKQVLLSVPTDFGWKRTTWTRELLALELVRRGLPRVAPCTMGRALAEIGARLGMPKPTVGCPWESGRRERVLRNLRRLARNATVEEPVFYEDEMDVHLNPKIGRDWMLKGQRRYVLTPGQNRKRFVAGALNAATGKMTWVDAPTKASDLFCKLVWKLVGEHRRARRIHLIVDNYIIHASKKTKRFLAQFGDRVVLHFLPPYCPDDNRIERVWLDLHANVTRNHRCRSMEELMVQVVAFLRAFNQRKKLNPSLRLAAGVSGSRSVV
jgi:transposase